MTDQWRWVNGKELYDINKDPDQSNNVSFRYPDVVEKLSKVYEAWWEDVYQSTKKKYEIIIQFRF